MKFWVLAATLDWRVFCLLSHWIRCQDTQTLVIWVSGLTSTLWQWYRLQDEFYFDFFSSLLFQLFSVRLRLIVQLMMNLGENIDWLLPTFVKNFTKKIETDQTLNDMTGYICIYLVFNISTITYSNGQLIKVKYTY